MRSILCVLIAIAVFLESTAYQDEKYCKPNLCQPGKKHIACKHSGKFDKSCPTDALIMKLEQKEKNIFVNHHNSVRNKLAWGKHKGFPTASKMLTLQWDDELATLASLNVMQCKMKHDSCRSTPKFKYAGQNLASSASFPHHLNLDSVIKKSIDNWFNEIKDAKQGDVKQCCKSIKNKTIGHFTQVVQDKANRVGCAVARYSQDGMKHTLIACN